MAINLIDLIKGQLTPEIVSQVSTHLGENNSNVSNAISAFLPAIVGGMANNSGDGGIFNSLKSLASSDFVSQMTSGSDSVAATIKSVISTIFGSKTDTVVNTVSNFAGVSPASGHQLLDLVGGSTFGFLGKYISDNNLDHNAFTNLLNDQKGIVSSLLPAGLSLAGLGLGGAAAAASTATPTVEVPKPVVNTETEYVESGAHVTRSGDVHTPTSKPTPTPPPSNNNDNGGGGSILKWLLPLLLLLLVGFFLWKQCGKKADTAPTGTSDSASVHTDTVSTASPSDTAKAATVPAQRESVVVTLPSGKTLNAYKGGIEDQIVTFLKSDEYKNDTEAQLKDKWFNFDNLNFEFNSTKLTPESQVQLDNLKAILKEFPDANIKVGAYTDKKGDEAANLKLSQERALAVKTALGTPQVKEAAGYGSQFATVPATASDKEREADRKTAIRFVK
ncbi:OmpA family protein [Soonwooa sp.]|uniref:OmpA family protein n=1 Tax=Soonwooa sp. TaxID=1938592 RepID=UPI00261FCD53|nr:OmpA family protein [Soonwooa sp.]